MTQLMRILTAALLATAPLAAADIKLNAEYTGILPAAKSTLPVKGGNTYIETVTVDLEQGREVTVTADGAGDRVIALAVFDKGDNLIRRSFDNSNLTKAKLTPQELVATHFAVATGGKSNGKKIDPAKSGTLKFTVSANGKYTVMVMSNLSGGYKLTVSDPLHKDAPKERTADAIRKELEAAEKRVEELKKELKEKTQGNVGK